MKAANGLLMTERHRPMTLNDECGYIMLEDLSATDVGRFLS